MGRELLKVEILPHTLAELGLQLRTTANVSRRGIYFPTIDALFNTHEEAWAFAQAHYKLSGEYP